MRHGHAHDHPHADGPAHGHGHVAAGAGSAPTARSLPSPAASLLMTGAGPRLLGAVAALALLWSAVAWALGGAAG